MTGRVNIDVRGVELSNPVDAPLHELVARWSEAQARPCLCGGVILAKVGDPGPGVREHQSRPQHRKWSARVYG